VNESRTHTKTTCTNHQWCQ